MTAILVLLLLILLGAAASRWGADSRDSDYSLGRVSRPRFRGASR